jgi:hypothetical protein
MDWNYKNGTQTGGGAMSSPPMRSLDERRVDPGTIRRENVDRPSLLSPVPPKTPVRVGGTLGKRR